MPKRKRINVARAAQEAQWVEATKEAEARGIVAALWSETFRPSAQLREHEYVTLKPRIGDYPHFSVTFYRIDGIPYVQCNCHAGRLGRVCLHAAAVLRAEGVVPMG